MPPNDRLHVEPLGLAWTTGPEGMVKGTLCCWVASSHEEALVVTTSDGRSCCGRVAKEEGLSWQCCNCRVQLCNLPDTLGLFCRGRSCPCPGSFYFAPAAGSYMIYDLYSNCLCNHCPGFLLWLDLCCQRLRLPDHASLSLEPLGLSPGQHGRVVS